MIRVFRLWLARVKMRMLIKEIEDTIDDMSDAALADDDAQASMLCRYLYRLRVERTQLSSKIRVLLTPQTGKHQHG